MREQRLLYRLALGMPNQEDLVEVLSSKLGEEPESIRNVAISLSPWFRERSLESVSCRFSGFNASPAAEASEA
jgi:hypothetical protein